MSRSRHHNMGITANVTYKPHDTIPIDRGGEQLIIEFPVTEVKSINKSNLPLSKLDDYVTNKKTMVSEILRRKNLNEKLNFANAFYTQNRSEEANKQALTIFGHDKVYLGQTDDANTRASYRETENLKNIEYKETRVRDFLRKTEEIVEERKNRDHEDRLEEIDDLKDGVAETYYKMKKVVGHIIKADVTRDTDRFAPVNDEEIVAKGDIAKVKLTPRNPNIVLQTTSNIRQIMGYRSEENQDKIQAVHAEHERKQAELAALKADEEREDQKKISKYSDINHLKQKWKIYDTQKLKNTIRNEIVKEVMREEEKKNFMTMARHTTPKKPTERDTTPKKLTERERKATNDRFVEQEKQRLAEKSIGRTVLRQATTTVSPKKITRGRNESPDDYEKRKAFVGLSQPGAQPNFFKEHKIAKNFMEMAISKSLKNNGRVTATIIPVAVVS